jgi:hypothetical protein
MSASFFLTLDFIRPKQVEEKSGFKRYSSADSENMCKKIYCRQGAASKKFRDGGANSSYIMLISFKLANTLLWVEFGTKNTN